MDTLGARIKNARIKKGISLRAVAKEVAVSPGFLSLVERNQVMPSLTSLQKIASALEIPIAHLVEGTPEKSPVVKHNQRIRFWFPGDAVERESLTPGFNHRLQVFAVTLHPDQMSAQSYRSHPSEEFMIVLEGTLEVDLNGTLYVLEVGDTMLYDGTLPHRNRCVGTSPTRYLVINTPPVV